jgi:hypothetical protein
LCKLRHYNIYPWNVSRVCLMMQDTQVRTSNYAIDPHVYQKGKGPQRPFVFDVIAGMDQLANCLTCELFIAINWDFETPLSSSF